MQALLHTPSFDLLDAIAYWCFRATLLVVFISWLVRHGVPEVLSAAVAIRKAVRDWRHPTPELVSTSVEQVIPKT
jgi:hypothetical protein